MADSLSSSSSSARMDALRQLIGWARGDHYCKRCDGTGELPYAEGEDCPDCEGEGENLHG